MSVRLVEESDELLDRMQDAAEAVADELIGRTAHVLGLDETQRDAVRVLVCAGWSRGAAWEHNYTAENLERLLAPVLGAISLSRIETDREVGEVQPPTTS